MEATFKQVKQMLCAATALVHPDPAAAISLAVDASDSHVGAVLQQGIGAGKRPLAFYSKKLDAAQTRYSAFDRELLAAYLAIRHFRYSLEGRRFVLYTDHKPLTFALRKAADPWTARQQHQLAFIAEYTSEIQHIAGGDNVVADMLSRPATTADGDLNIPAPQQRTPAAAIFQVQQTATAVDFQQLAAVQVNCEQ
jgi:hypothetical protein